MTDKLLRLLKPLFVVLMAPTVYISNSHLSGSVATTLSFIGPPRPWLWGKIVEPQAICLSLCCSSYSKDWDRGKANCHMHWLDKCSLSRNQCLSSPVCG